MNLFGESELANHNPLGYTSLHLITRGGWVCLGVRLGGGGGYVAHTLPNVLLWSFKNHQFTLQYLH